MYGESRCQKDVYRVTAGFPPSEIYGITGQMRRAAISIPCNIAEGAARAGHKEFKQFLSIARGSLAELETQILIAKQLGYLADDAGMLEQINRIFRMLGGLTGSLRVKTQR